MGTVPADFFRRIVLELATALRSINLDALRTRMDPPAMKEAKTYPSIWDEDNVFDTYLDPAFEDLRAFYSAAADADQAVIQTIC